MENDAMRRIEAKLSAVLALLVEDYLRSTGTGKRRSRSIDSILADAGLGASEIAGLLGKTERAVYLALEKGRQSRKRDKGGDDD